MKYVLRWRLIRGQWLVYSRSNLSWPNRSRLPPFDIQLNNHNNRNKRLDKSTITRLDSIACKWIVDDGIWRKINHLIVDDLIWKRWIKTWIHKIWELINIYHVWLWLPRPLRVNVLRELQLFSATDASTMLFNLLLLNPWTTICIHFFYVCLESSCGTYF